MPHIEPHSPRHVAGYVEKAHRTLRIALYGVLVAITGWVSWLCYTALRIALNDGFRGFMPQ